MRSTKLTDCTAQIAKEPGWNLYESRFLIERPNSSRVWVSAGIHVGLLGGCWSSLSIAYQPTQRSAFMQALRRSGYTVDDAGVGRRSIRDGRELDSEVRRIDSVVEGSKAIDSPSARRVRPLKLQSPRSQFPHQLLKRMTALGPPWFCLNVSAQRKGMPRFVDDDRWLALSYCVLLLDYSDAPRIDVGVQIYPRKSSRVTPLDFMKIERKLRAHLEPHGYRLLEINMTGNEPLGFSIVEKSLATLAEARRERRRVERLVFGSP